MIKLEMENTSILRKLKMFRCVLVAFRSGDWQIKLHLTVIYDILRQNIFFPKIPSD